MPADDPARRLDGLVLSAHRAGGIPAAFLEIGEMVLDDLDQVRRGPAAGPDAARRARARGPVPQPAGELTPPMRLVPEA